MSGITDSGILYETEHILNAKDWERIENELCGEEEAPEPIEPGFIDLDERIREKEEE